MEKLVLMFLFFLTELTRANSNVEFQTGDIIFQTSNTNQSYAIMWASKSLYSHVGVIEVEGTNTYVIEAISKVGRTPLNEWIERGRFGLYSLFRYQNLNTKQRQGIGLRIRHRLTRLRPGQHNCIPQALHSLTANQPAQGVVGLLRGAVAHRASLPIVQKATAIGVARTVVR